MSKNYTLKVTYSTKLIARECVRTELYNKENIKVQKNNSQKSNDTNNKHQTNKKICP